MKRKNGIAFVVLSAVLALSLVMMVPARALTQEQLEYHAANRIYVYDPGNKVSRNCETGLDGIYNGVNYAGVKVWSDADLRAISANKSFYEKAESTYKLPWQILAVVHYKANNLLRSNPESGRNAYGVSGDEASLPAGAISDEEFQRQTNYVAEMMAESATRAGMNLSRLSDGNIQKIFYLYNGTSAEYEEKGRQLGLTAEQIANGGGSPYVMNRYDAKRDPSGTQMSQYWPGLYGNDGVYNPEATESGFGAYVLYDALMGSSQCSSLGDLIAETAMALSWEGLNSHDKNDPKPEYVDAMKAVDAYQRGRGSYPYGASCDQFVGTVMRYSGADADFPIFGPGGQKNHMASLPEMYEKVEANGDYNALQPGDIFVTVSNGAHIYIYVGIINGEMTQASASANERTAEHFGGAGAVYFSDPGIGWGTRNYEVYRRINQ